MTRGICKADLEQIVCAHWDRSSLTNTPDRAPVSAFLRCWGMGRGEACLLQDFNTLKKRRWKMQNMREGGRKSEFGVFFCWLFFCLFLVRFFGGYFGF